MPDIKTIVTIDGKKYTAYPARVEDTYLGYEDHGFLTASLHLDILDGGGVSFGFYALGVRSEEWPYKAWGRSEYLRLWVDKLMDVCGTGKWEKIPGAKIYVLFDGEENSYLGSSPVGISSLSGKTYFLPKEYETTLPADDE